ncbi:hypothetical protein QN277_003777 [Acacia crassicarpa]|uniref:Plastid movement impaired protein n=1 Tax=Acacia crassicarpa TaxID=499986 RepID=A0AAE1MCY3_9FABA|nr:hypothetical protein QN277_003777 [Acacia crassicarpa]
MGNSLGGKKTVKVMKIDGETMKLRAPVKAEEVLKNHPGLVLLDSEAVKHYGVRAKALEAHKDLEPKRLYFLVEPPKRSAPPRRIRSGINMSAKDRLENLMLARRSTSDLSIMKQNSDSSMATKEESENGMVKLKLKLPKKEVEKLIRESKDEAEAAQRIMGLYMAAASATTTASASASTTPTTSSSGRDSENESEESGELREQKVHLKVESSNKPREKLQKRVSFKPITHHGGREIVVTS